MLASAEPRRAEPSHRRTVVRALISHSRHSPQDTPPLRNWAGNLVYGTNRLHEPASVDQLQDIVKHCVRLRPLGTRHSFNGIADSTDNWSRSGE